MIQDLLPWPFGDTGCVEARSHVAQVGPDSLYSQGYLHLLMLLHLLSDGIACVDDLTQPASPFPMAQTSKSNFAYMVVQGISRMSSSYRAEILHTHSRE